MSDGIAIVNLRNKASHTILNIALRAKKFTKKNNLKLDWK